MPTNRSFLLAAAIAAALAFPVGAAYAQNIDTASADRHKQVDAIFAPWKTRTTPGCAVGVSSNGRLDYAQGYGMSNMEYDLPITPQSVFHVASISKQFTAFSIGLLAQEGKLSLSDDVRKYVPELPDFGKTITIDHLIHHTNGLREQGQLLSMAGWRNDDLSTEGDVLWALSRQRALNFAPGTEVVYGNTAYTLLAVIVKRVSGQSLRDFADARIFKPLGMRDTRFLDDYAEIVPRRATAYSPRSGGGWVTNMPHITHYGSTSLNTTVGDLLKWEQNLVDARVGGKPLLAMLQTSGRLNDGTSIGYGGGLRIGEYRGLRLVSHDGADNGFRSDALLFPDQHLAVVALCNGATIVPADFTRKIAEVYLGQRMKDTMPPAITVSPSTLTPLAGNYWSAQTDEIVRLEIKDGVLRQVGSSIALLAIGSGVFRPADATQTMQEWRFAPTSANAQQPLSIRDFWPTTREFVRVSEPMPTPAALASYAGAYRSTELDATYTVRIKDGRVAVRWPRRDEVMLDAVGGDRFVGSLGTVTFTRTQDGKIDGLTISSRRLRRMHADRLAEAEATAAASLPATAPEALADR